MLDLDGRQIPIEDGDTIAAAAFRAGVRTFSRSFKFHRPRGLSCCSGDCPNCLVTVDGVPGVHACTTSARPGQQVRRGGTPSAERDVLGVLWRLRRLLPVGFYYKTLTRPRWAWARAEPLVRRMTGLGAPPLDRAAEPQAIEHVHADVIVVGGGPAGLAAASAAAEQGRRVVVFERHELAGGPLLPADRDAVLALARALREHPAVRIEEHAPVFGIYPGPEVAASNAGGLLIAHAGRVVVATGATERQLAVPGGDLPGVWLGRGAARLALDHGLAVGWRVVLAGGTRRAEELGQALRGAGAQLVATLAPSDRIVRVEGRGQVAAVVVEREGAPRETIACDALVVSTGLSPRDGLLRQGAAMPEVCGAGELLAPDCDLEQALASGREAALAQAPPPYAPAPAEPLAAPLAPTACACLCEDVLGADLEQAWREGFRSTEILKRYTTMTMGPCQGQMCQATLRAFVAGKGGSERTSAVTTSRPPAGSVTIAAAAAADVDLEYRTALHERHLAAGAKMEWLGHWRRPWDYGDAAAEIRAVHEGVSIMDLSTLTKLEVAGPDAEDFVDRIYPIRTRTIAEGRYRYGVLLDERGHIFEDGLVCRLGEGRFYLTMSSGGLAHGESWLRQWADLWGMRVRILSLTSEIGAIVLAGPKARATLARLTDAPVENEAIPFLAVRELTVAGIPCRVARVGFLGELSYELHHDAGRSVELWDALMEAGAPDGLIPHGLFALDVLRLEKGHIVVGVETDMDTTPRKLGLERMIAMDKDSFLGQKELQRLDARLETAPLRKKLVGVAFPAGRAANPGAAVHDGRGHVLGYLTSAAMSEALGHGIALAWVDLDANGQPPARVVAEDLEGKVVAPPFYDPEGLRVRA